MTAGIPLLGQLLAAVALILAPTLAFLACWYGLHVIRNERLIQQLSANRDQPVHQPRFDFSVLQSLTETETKSSSENVCVYCGRRCSEAICPRCDER